MIRCCIVAVALLTGCKTETLKLNPITGLEQVTCDTTSDCPRGLVCLKGFCQRGSCTAADQCDPGELCNSDGLCVLTSVARAQGQSCDNSSQCLLAFTCTTGTCQPAPGSCAPETDAQACQRLGMDCGSNVTVTDNCGNARMVTCGSMGGQCAAPLTCGASTGSVCSCPQTDQTLCGQHGWNCATVSATNTCGETRNLDCGSCPTDQTCATNQPNVCACNETDAEACTRLGYGCGTGLAITDRCGLGRTVTCGAPGGGCSGGEVCNTSNVCVCTETDAAMCDRLQVECGALAGTDYCGLPRMVASCGSCLNGTCAGNSCPNVCGATGFTGFTVAATQWGANAGACNGQTACPTGATTCLDCGGQDAMSAMTGDGGTIVWKNSGCGAPSPYYVADLVAPTNLYIESPITLDGVTSSFGESDVGLLDPFTIVFANSQTSFATAQRPARLSGAFKTVNIGVLGAVNSAIATLAQTNSDITAGVPVLSGDGLSLYFLLSGSAGNTAAVLCGCAPTATPSPGACARPAPYGIYRAHRVTTSDAFPPGVLMPATVQNLGWYITGVSADDRTALLLVDEGNDGGVCNGWQTVIATRSSRWTTFAFYGRNQQMYRATLSNDCDAAFANPEQNGCGTEDIARFVR